MKDICLNDAGRLIGESHPGAIVSDHDVTLILELRAGGMRLHEIAQKFEVSKTCIAKIVSGRRRAQWAARTIDVDQVMALAKEGLTFVEIAQKLEVSKTFIAKLVAGRRAGPATEHTIKVSVKMDRGA